MSDNEKPNIMTFINNLYQCESVPSETSDKESETSDKESEKTDKESEKKIGDLWSTYKRKQTIPDKWTLPSGAITNASELKLCNFYSLYQILPPGVSDKLIDVKLTQEYKGIIKPPFYFVNRKKRFFGIWGGGKKSRKNYKKRRHTRRRQSNKHRK